MKTVKELIEILSTMPDDAVVIISSDAEGNGHSPLCDITAGKYEAENTWSGYFHSADDDEQAGVDCVSLWPVN